MDSLPVMDITAPPIDPRQSWSLPAPGEMTTVARLDELTTRVLAPNPSLMTLDGTNTYIVGERGRDAAIIDPGPERRDHLARVERALHEAQHEIALIFVTHHHGDHAEAASAWADHFGARVVAKRPDVAGEGGRIVEDGERLEVGGVRFEVIATPGHTGDHLSVRLPTGAVLTGDHVLGRGTSVVAWPDGDLTAYLESLRRMLELGPAALYPGHGPEMLEDPTAVLTYYREHREFRERQIIHAIGEGSTRVSEVVSRIYAGVDQHLLGAAEASTRAAIASLEAREMLRLAADGRLHLL